MAKVVIIGAGGVGTVVAHKCAQNPDVFNEIVIASRNKAKCDKHKTDYDISFTASRYIKHC